MMNGIGVACGAAEALICRQETGLAAIICTMQVEDVAVIDLEGNHIAGCLNAFTRDMISGRGFIGIAAQSLGTGRPVLPPQLAAMLPCVITKSWC